MAFGHHYDGREGVSTHPIHYIIIVCSQTVKIVRQCVDIACRSRGSEHSKVISVIESTVTREKIDKSLPAQSLRAFRRLGVSLLLVYFYFYLEFYQSYFTNFNLLI